MLREEIVAYMDKLQQVRNMMYVAVAAILGFSAQGEYIMFISLLTLLVVYPSYACAIEYWEDVRKLSAYLVVFHEGSEDCSFHWESRNKMFHTLPISKMGKVIRTEKWTRPASKESVAVDIRTQLACYYSCACICFLCFIFTFFQQLDKAAEISKVTMHEYLCSGGTIFGIPGIVWILIGVASAVLIIVLFRIRRHTKSYEEYLLLFTQVRDREKLTSEGMDWKNEDDIEDTIKAYKEKFGK